ncbi:MAG: hypothetical protein ABFC62_01435 [Clostridiaceae bacterium]
MTSEANSGRDALGLLLKEIRPMPNAAFTARVEHVLCDIAQPRPSRIGRFALRRPLTFAAILILVLALCAGTALALEALFRNVFGNAQVSIEEKTEDARAQYPALREEIAEAEEKEPEKAAALDSKLDFEATNDAILRSVMWHVAENAVVVGEQSGGVLLSEFAVYDVPGMAEEVARRLFLGCAAPADADLKSLCPSVYIDGYLMAARYWDVPWKNSGKEQYAIYEFEPNRSASGLPAQSLITVEMGGTQFCFRYDWETKAVALPAGDAERQGWLAESERLEAATAASLPCVCLTGAVTLSGVTVSVSDVALDENVLRISADIAADESIRGHYGAVTDITVTVKGRAYKMGVSLNVIRVLPDDFDFSKELTKQACWDITLPFHANELAGEELVFAFTLRTDETTDAEGREHGTTLGQLAFRLKVSKKGSGES